jgi:hypothetical protein
LTHEINPIPPLFSSLAAALVIASGGQGGRFLKKLPPWTPRQKLLIITAKRKKLVFCLHPGPDHVKYNLEKETK